MTPRRGSAGARRQAVVLACLAVFVGAGQGTSQAPVSGVESERAPEASPGRESGPGAFTARDPSASGATARQADPDPIQALLDAEADRIDALVADVERRRAAIEEAKAREEAAHAAEVQTLLALREQVRAAPQGSTGVNLLYEDVVEKLRRIMPDLDRALERWRLHVDVPEARLDLDGAVRATPAFTARAPALESRLRQAATAIGDLEREESGSRWMAVDLKGFRFEQYGALRTECLEKLGDPMREPMLSLFSVTGIEVLKQEVKQLTLSAKLYGARRVVEVRSLAAWSGDIFNVGTVTWEVVQLVALVVFLIWLRRRLEAWAEGARRALFPRVRGLRGKRLLESVVGALLVIAPWALFLAGLFVARRIVGTFGARPIFTVPYTIAMVYGAYRLGIDSAYALLVRAAGRYRLALDGRRRAKILTSVRAVARLLALLAVVLPLSAHFLGKGYLYHVVLRLAWIVGLLIAFRLIREWREEICETYLKIAPRGPLANAVRRSRERWYGIFVAGASFLWLAGSGAAVLARDFALGFDQTRKALAFLFLRRVQKQAEQRGYAQSRQEDLPPALVAAFDEAPATEDSWIVDHFPGRDALGSMAAEWQTGRGGGAFALTGEPGVGKTSWLARVPDGEVRLDHLTLGDRPRTAALLAGFLSEGLLGRDGGTDQPRKLAAALAGGPPRLVTLDVAQNLFLKRVGGYEAFACLTDLIDATSAKVLWVCSFNAFGWQHLAAVRPDVSVFRKHHVLPAWSEERIRDLVRARLAASGVDATYEDLVVDRMEGVSARATLLHAEEGYTRLLWDYADGNPRVVLHFWLRSVVPESDRRVRVRLFRAPDPAEIEAAGEAGLFVLSAIVNHENLTLEECAEVTGHDETLCRIHLERLRRIGALTLGGTRYRVSTRWQRAAIRLLRRRNLIAD